PTTRPSTRRPRRTTRRTRAPPPPCTTTRSSPAPCGASEIHGHVEPEGHPAGGRDARGAHHVVGGLRPEREQRAASLADRNPGGEGARARVGAEPPAAGMGEDLRLPASPQAEATPAHHPGHVDLAGREARVAAQRLRLDEDGPEPDTVPQPAV